MGQNDVAAPVLGFMADGKAAPNISITVGGRPCALVTVTTSKIRCRTELRPDDGTLPVTLSVLGKGLAVPTAAEVALLRPLPKKLSAEQRLKVSPPTVLPSRADIWKSFTDAPCKPQTLSTDCPTGWSCCGGRCAAVCISLAQLLPARPKS